MRKKNIGTRKEQPSYSLQTRGQRIFGVLNSLVLLLLGILCLIPFWYIFCQSLSSNSAILAGRVGLWPIGVTLENYQYVVERAAFWNALGVTLQRVVLAVPISLFLTISAAYPLSKDKKNFHGRSLYAWLIFMTMLFNGGMIPLYLLVNKLKLLNTIWALVLPCAVNAFNTLLVLSFFRQLPGEMLDAAMIDGAGQWRTLWQIVVPVSMPVIATVTLFTLVQHWNSWFDGMVYMKSEDIPMQTYLRNIIISFDFTNLSPEEQRRLANMNDRAIKSAQMVLGMLPILLVYPFLQRYFVSGITLGSVKS